MNIFRKFNQLEIDGYVAVLLIALVIPAALLAVRIGLSFDLWESAYGQLVAGLSIFSLSIGFAISGLRQSNPGGRLASGLALFLAMGFVFIFLFPSVS